MQTTAKQHRKQKLALKRKLRRNEASRYPLERSPLNRVDSIHTLAKLVGLSVEDFRAAAREPTFNTFDTVPDEGKSARHVQEPTQLSLTLHYHFARLLDRIQRPDFLHSATKRRSHVTNAQAHSAKVAIFCTDISKFYENTTQAHVKSFLLDLGWAPDLARMMSFALCADGHLPTGSAVSPILSYFAHRHAFDAIATLCQSAGVTMTLYVDDVTISGEHATKTLLYRIKAILTRCGLKTHKERWSQSGTMVVTGAVPSLDGLRLRNKHRLSLMNLIERFRRGDFSIERKIAGKIASASNVDRSGAAVFRARFAAARSEVEKSASGNNAVKTKN